MIYNSNKRFQKVLSRFWGAHISRMEIVYGATLFYFLLITCIFLDADEMFQSCMPSSQLIH
jgi:hypothetical protein